MGGCCECPCCIPNVTAEGARLWEFPDAPEGFTVELLSGPKGIDEATRNQVRAFSGNFPRSSPAGDVSNPVPASEGSPGEPCQAWYLGSADPSLTPARKVELNEYLVRFNCHSTEQLGGYLIGLRSKATGEIAASMSLYPPTSPGRSIGDHLCSVTGIMCCFMGCALPPNGPEYGPYQGRMGQVGVDLTALKDNMGDVLNGSYWNLEILAVDPAFQGQKLAGKMIDVAFWLADQDPECKNVFIACCGDRLPETYRKLGFNAHSEDVMMTGPDGDDAPPLRMTALLRSPADKKPMPVGDFKKPLPATDHEEPLPLH